VVSHVRDDIHLRHDFLSKDQVPRLSFHGFFQDNNLDHDCSSAFSEIYYS
jgi:hypothetical protein